MAGCNRSLHVLPSVWTWKSFTIQRCSSDRALARARKHRIDIARASDRMTALRRNCHAQFERKKARSSMANVGHTVPSHWSVHSALHERWKKGRRSFADAWIGPHIRPHPHIHSGMKRPGLKIKEPHGATCNLWTAEPSCRCELNAYERKRENKVKGIGIQGRMRC